MPPDYPATSPRRRILWVIFALIVLCGIAYAVFRPHGAPGGKAGGPQAQGAIPVDVQTMQLQPVRSWTEFSGRTRAVDAAEIRPEVSGRITEIRFQDGQNVKAGDILLVIDPRPYEATLAKAKAALITAETNAEFARKESVRAGKMIQSQAIAQRLVDSRANDARVADAAIQSAQAQMIQAKLDVEHAYVRAPISGRAGRAEITVGNLVEAGPNAPLLTTIVSNKDIYADFEVDERTYLQAVHSGANGREQESKIPVELVAAGDKDHPYKGNIYTFDNHIDNTSGTIRARAKFKNEDGSLVPGMFVTVRLGGNEDAQALLVPERAIGTDQNKKFVYVVGDGNKAQYREVELGQSMNGSRTVLSGLQPGDRVVVDGVQHIRPDAVVDPKEEEPNAPKVPQKTGKAATAEKHKQG